MARRASHALEPPGREARRHPPIGKYPDRRRDPARTDADGGICSETVSFLILTIVDTRSAPRLPALALLAACALAGCTDGDAPIGPAEPVGALAEPADDLGEVEREARAAELFAPREKLALTGTRWQAEATVLPNLGKTPLRSGIVYTAEFEEGGKRARGHDGCGPWERSYALDGQSLTLTAPDAVDGVGPPPCELSELAAGERSLIELLLGRTGRFEIRGDRLVLNDPEGAALVLRGRPLDAIAAGVGPGLEPEFAPGERIPFTVLERSDGLNLGAREVTVPERFVTVHETARFEALWRNAHSDPDAVVPALDFDVGTALGAFSPLRPSLGHAIRIDAIEAGGGRGPGDGPLVRVMTTVPGPGCDPDPTASVPYEIVGVPAVIAPPRFEETVVEGEPCG